MLARFVFKSLGAAAVCTLIGAGVFADEPPEAVDVKQIEAEAAAYVEAFNAKDAAAISQHWSETGVYVRPADDVRLVGRKAIEEEFRLAFAEQPEAVLAVKVDTIRFVTNDVAIEEGIAAVASPGAAPCAAVIPRYTSNVPASGKSTAFARPICPPKKGRPEVIWPNWRGWWAVGSTTARRRGSRPR